ncbi:MAG: hypothetical protein ACLQVK_14965 [Acidimicrobiales bacterium]
MRAPRRKVALRFNLCGPLFIIDRSLPLSPAPDRDLTPALPSTATRHATSVRACTT